MTGKQARRQVGREILVSWLPLSLVLLCYGFAQLVNSPISARIAQGSSNALGFGLHISEPVLVDRWLFGGVVPTNWLQDRFHQSTDPQWYDAVGALIYVSHFLVIPGVAIALWFRNRSRFREWIAAVLVMTGVGVAIYVIYPMAPPWLAAQSGAVDGIDRISGIGWQYLQLGAIDVLQTGSQNASNPVAAMPSLHAASAALLALFLWSGTSVSIRPLLVLYPALMGLTLIYTGEHYVIDVLAGWLVAVVAVGGARFLGNWDRRNQPRTQKAPSAAPAQR